MNTNSLILTLLNLDKWGPNKVYAYVCKHNFNYEECLASLKYELDETQKNAFKEQLVKTNDILKQNNDLNIKTINILDKNFPEKLYQGSDKCVFLFYKGNVDLLNQKCISIIGTRKPDPYFIEKGIKITKELAKKDYVIVSGLALGCDTIAHQSCLEVLGKTIAVLPSSCDNIQPTSNKKLANDILDNNGLLISEYSVGSTMSKFNFPRRDRIQSLLCSAILIIQASDTSGTMIATKKNIKDGKIVYAIKGNEISIVDHYLDVDSKEEIELFENWLVF